MKEIYTRRSIRKYTHQDIEKETIEKLLKAGMNAPSATNSKNYEFVVITDKETKQKINEAHPFAKMIVDAPFAIVVTARLKGDKTDDYYPQNCAAAMQNMLLEAESLDIGSVWLGVCPRKERMEQIAQIIHAPKDVVVFGIGVFGKKAEIKAANDFYDENKVRYNRY